MIRYLTCSLLASSLMVLVATAQVNGPGPSNPNDFDTVISVSGDQIFPSLSIGNRNRDTSPTTQLSISNRGRVISGFSAHSGSEVNLISGRVGHAFDAHFGSEINLFGGSVGVAFNAHSGSVVNLSGANVGEGFQARLGSEVNFSGGSVGYGFEARSGSEVTLIGGEFELDGVAYTDSMITLESGNVFTGALIDGSSFLFNSAAFDSLVGVKLMKAMLPTPISKPQIVTSDISDFAPSGLRAGQDLTLQAGGVLGENFAVVNATLNVKGGVVGSGLEVTRSLINVSGGTVGPGGRVFSGSEVIIEGGEVKIGFDANSGSLVHISGGSVGNFFDANAGSIVQISGGSVGEGFRANAGSKVALIGKDFKLGGHDLSHALVRGQPYRIIAREGQTLTGTLSDGGGFSFVLNSSRVDGDGEDFFSTDAVLTVTLVVPEPTSAMLLLFLSCCGFVARRRT